eukprot:CAMPEP_0202892592 /NCGR_PEP_ID=MMETSP1392-20130828/2305_1 /ASSEMBLY_ACC=CAM_ASM_000868 /TAXON_ID=225041 /ORGANISM="Chlamydomonas chlamydogama, Strain SAG 11-48b" /LENGTH=89 /DNA_ID=CAMNT_0049576605 /DNA_START=377 /DNA_END=647 /DNA_ORIENTATION=-
MEHGMDQHQPCSPCLVPVSWYAIGGANKYSMGAMVQQQQQGCLGYVVLRKVPVVDSRWELFDSLMLTYAFGWAGFVMYVAYVMGAPAGK